MNKFITKDRLKEKLCIDCRFYDERSFGSFCGLKKSKIGGGPAYSVSMARHSPFICFGREWAQQESIVACDTQEEADNLEHEQGVNGFLEAAKRIISGEQKKIFTCGLLEEAIERLANK